MFVQIVKVLTEQALRPGMDLSRAQAELAIAEAQLIRTEQNEAVADIDLGQALGDGSRSSDSSHRAPITTARRRSAPLTNLSYWSWIAQKREPPSCPAPRWRGSPITKSHQRR